MSQLLTIAEVKTAIGSAMDTELKNLTLTRQLNEDKEHQPWVSYWDNDKRFRVTMHEDVMKKIQTDVTKPVLMFKHELVPAKDERLAYTRFVISTPLGIEATF